MKESRNDKIKVAVIDFGSSAIKLAVAEKDAPTMPEGQQNKPNDFFRVIYLDSEPTEGAIQRGVVFNLSETSEKVRQLIARAEEDLGEYISHLYANISGQGLHSLLIKQSEEYDAPHEITQNDIERLWGNIEEHNGKFFLNADFAKFFVNGSSVLRPIGVKAMKLEVNIQTIVTDQFVVDNVDEVLLHKLGLEVEPYLIGLVELSKRVLTAEQKRIGSALIDFGAETTTICYFNHSVLESLRVIPMGGAQITFDLTSLDISPEEAERIKIANGSLTLDTSDKEKLSVKAPDMRTDKDISRYNVNQYIEARTREIVDNIKAVINRAKGDKEDYKIPGGIVITGGGSKLSGLPEYLKEQFGGELSVKQVGPAFFSDGVNQELITNPEFHSLYAMLMVADTDISKQSFIESQEETTSKAQEEPQEPIHIREESRANITNTAEGSLPFDEEELRPQKPLISTESSHNRKEKDKPKKQKKKSNGFLKRWAKFQDLFAMSEDEAMYSDDED